MAKKQRKSRNYSNLFKSPAADLPTPEEVIEKVASVSGVAREAKQVIKEPEARIGNSDQVTEKGLPRQQANPEVVLRVSQPIVDKAQHGKRGRKPLDTKRVPYTTSITEDHKFQLKYHAMRQRIRPSDMLNLILEKYFKENPI